MTEVQGGTITAKGIASTISFDGQIVTIRRTWAHRRGRGERKVPLSQISGVDVRKPDLLGATGALTLVVPGSDHRRRWGGRRNERLDENTVEFGARRYRDFEAMQNAILAAL